MRDTAVSRDCAQRARTHILYIGVDLKKQLNILYDSVSSHRELGRECFGE